MKTFKSAACPFICSAFALLVLILVDVDVHIQSNCVERMALKRTPLRISFGCLIVA